MYCLCHLTPLSFFMSLMKWWWLGIWVSKNPLNNAIPVWIKLLFPSTQILKLKSFLVRVMDLQTVVYKTSERSHVPSTYFLHSQHFAKSQHSITSGYWHFFSLASVAHCTLNFWDNRRLSAGAEEWDIIDKRWPLLVIMSPGSACRSCGPEKTKAASQTGSKVSNMRESST